MINGHESDDDERPDISPDDGAADAEAPAPDNEQLRGELAACRDKVARGHAELENQRKRMLRESEGAGQRALQAFIVRLLPVADSLENGIAMADQQEEADAPALLEGMRSTLKLYNAALASAEVETLDPLGDLFDPALHEAMLVSQPEEGTHDPSRVLRVFRKGYVLGDRLIRPAGVEVSGTQAKELDLKNTNNE